MFRNYLVVALRHLIRQRLYTVVNVTGLAVGLAGCLLIVGYVAHELSFERCHVNRDRIYRVAGRYVVHDTQVAIARVPGPLDQALQTESPDVAVAARFRSLEDKRIATDKDQLEVRTAFCAGPELLQVFTMPLVQGDPKTALTDPFSVLISESLARRFFGSDDPIGRSLKIMDRYDCQVAGVLGEMPTSTQLRCDFVLSLSSLSRMGVDPEDWRRLGEDYVYLRLTETGDPARVTSLIPRILETHLNKDDASCYDLILQPLGDIYLHSSLSWELEPVGNLTYVYLFSCIAILILVVAGVNFVNLTTVRLSYRTKEIGVRRVCGATRGHLVGQFLGESVLMAIISMLVGMVLFECGKSSLDMFLGRTLGLSLWNSPVLAVAVVVMTLVVGLAAGSYPALYLSRFQPIVFLRGRAATASAKAFGRRAMVLFQFTVAIALICVTLFIQKQVADCISTDAGFISKNVVLLDVEGDKAPQQAKLLRDRIDSENLAADASVVYSAPGEGAVVFRMFGVAGNSDITPRLMQVLDVDYQYISTFGLTLKEGRAFSQSVPSDEHDAVILSEQAVQELNLTDPVGTKLSRGTGEVTVIGVIKDFHPLPVQRAMIPFLLQISMEPSQTVAVRLAPGNIADQMERLGATWRSVVPDQSYAPRFLEDVISADYDDQRRIRNLFLVFAGLTVIVACLGVFGLSAFMAERRTKEIGIRRVLGASVASVMMLLSREFIGLVIAANVVAVPATVYFMNWWLADFAYRTALSWYVFAAGTAVAVAIALLTVAAQAVRVARRNPADTLRYE